MKIEFEHKGNLDLLSDQYYKVGIIGSRNVPTNDLINSAYIGSYNAIKGNVVVTGMAAGVDTWGMVGALNIKDADNTENKKTLSHIAVIPCIDYDGIPQNNHILLDEILEKKGLILALKDPLKDYKKMYLRRNDLLLEHVNELITVGQLGRGAAYTAAAGARLGIKVTNL